MKKVLGFLIGFLLFCMPCFAVTLEWDKPTSGGTVEGYYLQYWQQPNRGDIVREKIENPDQLEITIPNDVFNEGDVWFAVIAYNTTKDGTEQWGEQSNVVRWYKEKDAPGACILRMVGL